MSWIAVLRPICFIAALALGGGGLVGCTAHYHDHHVHGRVGPTGHARGHHVPPGHAKHHAQTAHVVIEVDD